MNSAYRGESGLRSWTTEAHFISGQRIDRDRLAELIQKPGTIILIAENFSGKIQGCVELRKEGSEAYLGMLTVDPSLQRVGLGSMLLEESELWVQREFNANAIHMNVISIRLELIEWYLRRGYKIAAETSKFPYGDNRFGRPLRDDLEFVVLRKALE